PAAADGPPRPPCAYGWDGPSNRAVGAAARARGSAGARTCGRSPQQSRRQGLGPRAVRPVTSSHVQHRPSSGDGTVTVMSTPDPSVHPAATGESEEVEALRARLEPLLPRAVEDLKDLVRIPSIAFAGYDTEPVRRSAEAVAELLRGAGMAEVTIEAADGAALRAPRRPAHRRRRGLEQRTLRSRRAGWPPVRPRRRG